MNKSNNVVSIVALVLALVSFMLLLVSLTDLGRVETLHYVVGGIAATTTIVYVFLMIHSVRKLLPFVAVASWLFIAGLNFAQDASLVAM